MEPFKAELSRALGEPAAPRTAPGGVGLPEEERERPQRRGPLQARLLPAQPGARGRGRTRSSLEQGRPPPGAVAVASEAGALVKRGMRRFPQAGAGMNFLCLFCEGWCGPLRWDQRVPGGRGLLRALLPGASPGRRCDVRSRSRPALLLVRFAPLSLPERQRAATQFWIVGKLTPGTFLPSDPGQTGPGVKSAGRWLLPWG